MLKLIRFRYNNDEVTLDTAKVAAINIFLGESDDGIDDEIRYVMTVTAVGAIVEPLFLGEFKSKAEATVLRDRILEACEFQAWFRITDEGEDSETVLDRWQVSGVEVLTDDFDDEFPHVAVFLKKDAPEELLYSNCYRTKAEAIALRDSFLECLKVH